MWMLLHGFTGSPRSWETVREHARLGSPPLTPTLAGHGSDWDSELPGSFEGEVTRLRTLAASMETPRCIAGYSLGARVALGMLVTDPDLFDAAVLIGVHPGLVGDDAREERRAIDAERARTLRTSGLAAFVSSWEAGPLFESQQSLPERVRLRQREIRLSHDAEGLARSLELLGLGVMPDLGAAMGSTRLPVLLMAGGLDSKFKDIAARLDASHDHVTSIVVEGAGHNLLLEAPSAVARAMERLDEQILLRERP